MRKGNIVVSVMAFFAIFFVFCSFAIDFSMVIASRAQLQSAVETTALSAVSKIRTDKAEQTAKQVFSFFKVNGIQYAQITQLTVKTVKNAIYIKASAPAQTYFLSALGINSIEIQAQAAAIIAPNKIEKDTSFNLENHLQYTSPVLITAKDGDEINIISENTTKYRVFAGLNDNTADTKWVEITCSSNDITAQNQTFDLNAECINTNGNISVAKYIRIVNNSANPLAIESVSLTNVAKLIPTTEFTKL